MGEGLVTFNDCSSGKTLESLYINVGRSCNNAHPRGFVDIQWNLAIPNTIGEFTQDFIMFIVNASYI